MGLDAGEPKERTATNRTERGRLGDEWSCFGRGS